MARTEFTDDDEGKRVVNAAGDEIGIVAEVHDGTPHVDADPDMLGRVQSKLGWGDIDGDTYPLDHDDIAEVTDDEIRLKDM